MTSETETVPVSCGLRDREVEVLQDHVENVEYCPCCGRSIR